STRLDRPARFRSPSGSLFSLERGGADAGYFLSDDKHLLFVVVEATREKASFTNYRDAIEPLRATMARVGAEFPDVKAGLTGAPVLGNDEMEAAFRDSKRAAALAFVLTLGVLTVAFRRFGMPILVLGTLAVSVCWSLGVVTLVVGHLSIFSIMFISIVVGVGTDYGVYLLFRNDEERRLGRSPREALETTAMRAGPGMLGGAHSPVSGPLELRRALDRRVARRAAPARRNVRGARFGIRGRIRALSDSRGPGDKSEDPRGDHAHRRARRARPARARRPSPT